jgi:hypothetical protein
MEPHLKTRQGSSMKTIKGHEFRHVFARDIELLIDPAPAGGLPPVIGLMITTSGKEQFIMPLEYGCAKELGSSMLKLLRKHAPELFF